MSELTLRAASDCEGKALSDLAFRSKAHWGYDDAFMAMCKHELTQEVPKDKTCDLVVGEVDGKLVGFYKLVYLDAATVELDALFVEPAFIGEGHGRALIDDAKRLAGSRGSVRMMIHSDPNALGFYLAAGGRQTGAAPSGSIPGRTLPVVTIVL